MASFHAHLAWGMSLSGAAATSLLVAGVAGREDAVWYWGLGTLGSLLPDIDSDHSTPVRLAFTLASVLIAFAAMFSAAAWFHTVPELLTIWIAAYLFFRWGIFHLFGSLTTHRGIFHSLPAALLFAAITASTAHYLYQVQALTAWLCGLFVAFGYVVHLLLDELYSVNLFGLHTRRSFGTAFKLYYAKSVPSTLLMYLVLALTLFFSPDARPLADVLLRTDLLGRLEQSLSPRHGWFRIRTINR